MDVSILSTNHLEQVVCTTDKNTNSFTIDERPTLTSTATQTDTDLNPNTFNLQMSTTTHQPHINATQSINRSVKPLMISVNQINVEISHPWRIRVMIDHIYPTRTFENDRGYGEISVWDMFDNTGYVSILAFNHHSLAMIDRFQKGKTYEISGLTIRTASALYHTVPHPFELVWSDATRFKELNVRVDPPSRPPCVGLDELYDFPENMIIDVQANIVLDYGIMKGFRNNRPWYRRQVQLKQNQHKCYLVLWNDQAQSLKANMLQTPLLLQNVKIEEYNGSRRLSTMGNTRIKLA